MPDNGIDLQPHTTQRHQRPEPQGGEELAETCVYKPTEVPLVDEVEFTPAATKLHVLADPNHLQVHTQAQLKEVRKRLARVVLAEPGRQPKLPADFSLIERIGRGGEANVYRALQADVQREVCVRRLRDRWALSEAAHYRVIQEGLLAAHLSHPNILTVHQIGLDQHERPIQVTRLIDGGTWAETIAERDIDDNLDIFLDLCKAVSYAHSRGVIHRDIKPDNLLVGTYGDRVLIDWGLAVTVAFPWTDPLYDGDFAKLGTPRYMAPEMASGDARHIGIHSDIYLLGATLFQIVTGHAPHGGDTIEEVYERAVGNVIDSHKVERKLKGLLSIAFHCMEPEPRGRPKSAAAVAHQIRLWLERRDSIEQVARAQDDLRRARRHSSYGDFSHALFRFDEALRIWPDNPKAKRDRRSTIQEHASLALTNGDLDLAWELIESCPTDLHDLRTSIAAARARRANREDASRADRAREVYDSHRHRAAYEFLITLLQTANPENLGRTATVADLLHHAAGNLATQEHDNQFTLTMHEVLARTYHSLGEGQQARRQVDLFLEQVRQMHGAAASPESWRAWTALIQLLIEQQELDEALLIIDRMTADGSMRDQIPPLEWLHLEGLRGGAYHQLGRHDEAELIYRNQLTELRSLLGDTHQQVAHAHSRLGNHHLERNQLEAAMQEHQAALRITRQNHPAGDPAILDHQRSVAHIHAALGRPRESEGVQLAVWRAQADRLGDKHPQTQVTLANLGHLALHLGDLNTAEERFRRLVASRKEHWGASSKPHLGALNLLATTLLYQGRFSAGLALASPALEVWQNRFANESNSHIEPLIRCAELHLGQEDLATALELLHQARQVCDHCGSNAAHWLHRSVDLWTAITLLRRDGTEAMVDDVQAIIGELLALVGTRDLRGPLYTAIGQCISAHYGRQTLDHQASPLPKSYSAYLTGVLGPL